MIAGAGDRERSARKLNNSSIQLLQKFAYSLRLGIKMTGRQLGQLIRNKWGYSFDVQLRQVKGSLYLQVMWKYLEQASFPLSEAEYWAHLDSIAAYLNAWGCIDQVTGFVAATRERPRLGKAVSIPLDLGDRASEWIVEP